MDTAVKEALKNALFEGGENLGKKTFLPGGKAAKVVLDQLTESGFIEEPKKNKFSITGDGRKAWQEVASEDEKLELHKKEEQAKREAMVLCLEVVEKKAKEGKKLAKGDLTKHQAAIDAGLEQNLIEKVSADKYRLLAAGKEFLISNLPFEQQVDQLRGLFSELQSRWNAAYTNLQKELGDLGTSENGVATEAATSLNGKFEAASQTYETVLNELGEGSVWVSTARQFRTEVLTEAEAKQAQFEESSKARLAQAEELSKRSAREVEAHNNQVAQLKNLVDKLVVSLEEKANEDRATTEPMAADPTPESAETKALPETNSEPMARTEEMNSEIPGETGIAPASPTEEQVWETMRQSHDEIRRQNSHLGSFVNIPALTDRVTASVGAIPRPQFHEYLRKWQSEDKVILQVCSNPENEPRANEGIPTDNGLLFYVEIPS
ncbi:MAG: hypothetical protein ACFCD0_03225 [Gemmataceae bacterium]